MESPFPIPSIRLSKLNYLSRSFWVILLHPPLTLSKLKITSYASIFYYRHRTAQLWADERSAWLSFNPFKSIRYYVCICREGGGQKTNLVGLQKIHMSNRFWANSSRNSEPIQGPPNDKKVISWLTANKLIQSSSSSSPERIHLHRGRRVAWWTQPTKIYDTLGSSSSPTLSNQWSST